MAGFIDTAILEQIRAASDVVDVIGSYLPLKRAGAIRYICVIIVVLAFINARYYSPEEIAEDARVQQNNFGDIRFPTWATLQDQVFNRSATGAMARNFIPFCLIPPTPPETKSLGKDSVVRARERTVDRVLDKR